MPTAKCQNKCGATNCLFLNNYSNIIELLHNGRFAHFFLVESIDWNHSHIQANDRIDRIDCKPSTSLTTPITIGNHSLYWFDWLIYLHLYPVSKVESLAYLIRNNKSIQSTIIFKPYTCSLIKNRMYVYVLHKQTQSSKSIQSMSI